VAGRVRKRKQQKLYVGVDPGKEGFICAVDHRCHIRVMWSIPYAGKQIDEVLLAKMIIALVKSGAQVFFLEHQQPHAKEGAVGAHSGGTAYGALRMACAMAGILGKVPYEILRPEDWKRRAKIPVPSVPKAKLPPEPEKTKKADHRRWKKEVEKIKAKRSREVKKRRKAHSIAMAERLQPHYDFYKTARSKGPHDGKCESFLLAREAWKQARGIRDDAT